jgi:hypothetical protein
MKTAERLVLAAGFAAALALRLAFFAGFSGNYDTASYEEVARTVRAGGDPWSTDRYNYSPVWAGVLVGLRHVADAAGVSLATAVGVLLLAGDAAAAALLRRLAGGGAAGARAALLFFANPVSILVSSHHRAFDGLALLLLLAALLAFRRDPLPTGRVAVALAGSLLVKHVAAFHPLLFLRGPRRRGLPPAAVAAVYAAFAASFLPFLGAWPAIRRNVLLYGGLGGLYGTDALLLVPGVPFWVPRVLFAMAAIAAVALLLRRRVETARASLLLFLVTLVFLPGIGRQYFVWPIAIGALFPGMGYAIYTVVATTALAAIAGLAPSAAHLPGWYGVWWAALLWLLREARRGALRGSGLSKSDFGPRDHL